MTRTLLLVRKVNAWQDNRSVWFVSDPGKQVMLDLVKLINLFPFHCPLYFDPMLFLLFTFSVED